MEKKTISILLNSDHSIVKTKQGFTFGEGWTGSKLLGSSVAQRHCVISKCHFSLSGWGLQQNQESYFEVVSFSATSHLLLLGVQDLCCHCGSSHTPDLCGQYPSSWQHSHCRSHPPPESQHNGSQLPAFPATHDRQHLTFFFFSWSKFGAVVKTTFKSFLLFLRLKSWMFFLVCGRAAGGTPTEHWSPGAATLPEEGLFSWLWKTLCWGLPAASCHTPHSAPYLQPRHSPPSGTSPHPSPGPPPGPWEHTREAHTIPPSIFYGCIL